MTAKKSNSPRVPIFSVSKEENKRTREILFGGFLILSSILFFIAFTSYFFSWEQDQSTLNALGDRSVQSSNILSKLGAAISHFFIFKLFGLAAYIIVYLLSITGFIFFFNTRKEKLLNQWTWGLYYTLWFALLFGYYSNLFPVLSGVMGFEITDFITDYIGSIGTGVLLIFGSLIYIVLHWKITPELILLKIKSDSKEDSEIIINENFNNIKVESEIISEDTAKESIPLTVEKTVENIDPEASYSSVEETIEEKIIPEENIEIEINDIAEEDQVEKNLAQELVEKFGAYDPTLELSKYQYPTLDLLKDYGDGSITINQEELEANKNKIVDTLKNYKIGIANIKANIGPTVTLYEIVPEAGIRISKIKNLEDDIALSLAALGIRIIAPIPGKGTIGIEVPNQNPSIVSMRSVIASQKFQTAEMELPIALGKTISNETFVVDLAKMPHLLMAGATGQGKSVGLNAVLTSLLYKKHPAEVKFVLVDPKKVELNIYNKIERHYLAKLPDSEDAIITDNTKVINTLNSLCIEMDNRYELLKNGMCRNLKEYNAKFKARKLNPDEGHCFLPYIVLVVDEFADLIMTAGKEVETPIARLAQLARAIGIHLIIATQRPSVNVITGIIKANFPARIAFRVTSKIDSRTILDSGGADQLIGRGDMLYTQGNDLTRIQCAFVDTPEVEKIVEYIGAQKAYPEAHILPEFVGEESTKLLDNDISDRDALFREAAEVIVTAQQGSASLLQRKLKLGYNRAGRIVDQMEAAGIVGPFEGSKARQVLIPDLTSLEQLLNNE
ncbi:DNA translocase FtsK [Flavobacteriaceae bacterium]|uniref:FtsK/SpoIIIE family DNA translocase n=1 Tax=Candidatus Arcticimaribacter forsetii TaxID=2820661 RepID=UPI0020772D6E|nr:DNA translocase FtsK [Candidatus Arcticimaribacter forsetii]MDB2325853.1 DNA translocase FtsK [Flavobacteriaceae bacterium]MDB2329387.1 DNA translocase FtsK [Flavobacteriaceae bacterium]MDB2345589.1 DNA translocase FtsK [Flavobacteriaceae bacterium]MDB4716777.1 DNA translocase FtsK [Flavobacteriaceae bacterium]MDB4751949.1 DNA translocase FtsK [Flavobacteriaceae bacterium]